MPEIPPKVLGWLHNVLSINEYHDVNRTFSDVTQCLSQNSTLLPRTDVHTFEDGRSSLLLHLKGTLSVPFRGNPYSFPISIWIPHRYASQGPIVFAVPSSNMTVRPGQYVSNEGRIYHPYLAHWQPDRSNLAELIYTLKDVFSREPPVISKGDRVERSPSKRNGEAPPLPPLPQELGGSISTVDPLDSYPLSSVRPPPPPPKSSDARDQYDQPSRDRPPPVPPRPRILYEQGRLSSDYHFNGQGQPAQDQPSLLYALPTQYTSQRVGSLRNEQHRPTPANHQRPSSNFYEQQSFANSQYAPSNGNAHPPNSDLASHQINLVKPSPMVPGICQVPNELHGFSNQSQQQARYYQQSPNTQQFQYQSKYPDQSRPGLHQLPKPPVPQPPEDLLTSPFDTPLLSATQRSNIPAPPIPPNPQKDALLSALSRTLIQHLQASIAQNNSSLQPLHAQNSALQSTLYSVQQEQQALTSLSTSLGKNEAILHKAMRDADKVIENAKHRTVPGVDEVLVAPTVVGEQLYALVAEEISCRDSRALLGRMLDRGRVGCEGWVKEVRRVSREEFLKKVLVGKCARGMGLREGEEWGSQ